MRLEERQIEGHEHEQDRQREKTPLEEKRTEDLLGIGGDALRGTGMQRHEQLLDVMRTILEDRTKIDLTALQLPQREHRALEAIQVAVSGRSSDKDQFVYAEDRRTMLEQALAILQPDLISHDPKVVNELRVQLAHVQTHVTELREHLMHLEDGQQELRGERAAIKAAATDTGDKAEPDGEKPGSTLYGPERKEPAKPASTLSGPEVKHERPPSTLSGPERAPPATVPSTLGDPDEIAEVAKKKPWWRRAFSG